MEIQAFSLKSYKNLIQDILAMGYRFVLLDDFDLDSPEKQIILRHDVDYSPHKAVEMAKIDYSLGCCSTFFFLVRGHWYNFLGHYTQVAINEINKMGFPIGLHYAPPPHIEADQEAQCQQLLKDFSVMRSEFPFVYPAFSWHVPPPLALDKGRFIAPDGLVDMYSEPYFQKIKYVSDSSLRNSYEYLKQTFLSYRHNKVQLVLHPICWIGSQEMVDLTDLIGEIFRSIIADGELDLLEKTDYRALLPSGMPLQTLDQIAAMFAEAVQIAKNENIPQ